MSPLQNTYYIKSGSAFVEASPFAGVNEGLVVLGAVRNALGSSSYSPGAIMEFCRDYWGAFTHNTRHNIMRDVMIWIGERHEWVVSGQADSAWPDQWRAFLSWCFAQDAYEAQGVVKANLSKRDSLKGVSEFFKYLE